MGNAVRAGGSAYRGDDTIVNLLRFDRGTVAKTLTTFAPQRPQIHAVSIYGSKRTFVNDIPNGKMFDGDQPENESSVSTPYPGIEKFDLIPDFIQAIRSGREPMVTTRDVFRVMDVCFATWESVKAQRTIKVDYLN